MRSCPQVVGSFSFSAQIQGFIVKYSEVLLCTPLLVRREGEACSPAFGGIYKSGESRRICVGGVEGEKDLVERMEDLRLLSGVKLNGKMVGVFKKDESAARKLIDAHRLMGHAESVEPADGRIKVCHFKSQMT